MLRPSQATRAADPPPRSREVQELIEEAEKAAKRLDLARARELWARINDLAPSTMAVCQLGVFDLRLGRLEDAAAELSTCVAHMPAPTNDIERRRYEMLRRTCRFASGRRARGVRTGRAGHVLANNDRLSGGRHDRER
ncbi:hypothetical protein [Sorangium sp. So ce176]|uniref:hypothetical protein n=1 Tax=Sorangium sp. So ce176 TaxID=3133286 RepID=UPI003F6154E0